METTSSKAHSSKINSEVSSLKESPSEKGTQHYAQKMKRMVNALCKF
jgi:hypothetical protein